MALPVLPVDVLDEILSQLTDETSESTLRSCSLVCHSFRRMAQKILFDFIFSVRLPPAKRSNQYRIFGPPHAERDPPQPPKLVALVKLAPHLIKYIKQLRIIHDTFMRTLDDRASTDLADALEIFFRKATNLRSLKLDFLSWHDIPPRLQDAILLLISVPSIQDITLEYVKNFPANLVQNLPPLLKSLSLKGQTFPSLPPTRKKLPKIESFTILDLRTFGGMDQFRSDAMERIVDMSQLKTFDVGICNENSMPVIEQLLRPTYNFLEHLILQFDITDPDSVSIDLNQFPYLTDITIIHFCTWPDCLSDIPPVVIWVTETMKKISYRNVLQNLSFRQVLFPWIELANYDLTLGDVWQELDTICSLPQLASSNIFRGITFNIESTMPVCDGFEGVARNRLPETTRASKLHIEASLLDWW
ncbi:hypothetical protein M378DRAFT_532003 [Amanita muscaria Koide BX008]|uniref:F-box domain-containing protein n=1 Tax=Amanita muscaria (strain Koide BX008) TaxID=946122 RepID=A0A0C2W557_AMAMK|nr:hypothetical protein M378DRAFT_532003 [Amanita muscaria Koide BX008]